MAEFIVTTLNDENDGGAGGTGLSLREALTLANNTAGDDTISFNVGLSGGTIVLTQGTQLEISSNVSIDGDLDNDGTPDITVSGNNATRVLLVSGGTGTIDGLTITGGYTGGTVRGGGLAISNGATATLTNSIVTMNASAGADGGGGGITVYSGGTLNLTGSTVSNNTAATYGGGIDGNGSVSLTNSTVSGNTAAFGGGFGMYQGSLMLTNSTVSGNTATNYDGGGIFASQTPVTLIHSTVSGNSSQQSYGGGISNYMGSSTISLTNSIVLGNSAATTGPEISGTVTNNNSIVSGTASLVFAALDGNGGGQLGSNGGPVQTIALRNDASNPALDAADNTASPTTDARGLGRSDLAGIGNNGSNFADLGAFEVQAAAANNPPDAVNDSDTTLEDTPVTVSVLVNDTDADLDTLTVTGKTNGANGAVAINSGTSVTYTPNANFNGTDTFTYTISDGNGGNDTATVTINVTAVNDPPDAVNDSAATALNTPVNIMVLNNDTDVDLDTLTVTGKTDGANGAVVINGGTSVTYTPTGGFNGTDTFTYTITDGNGGNDTATVTVSVGGANVAPDAVDDSGTTLEDTPVTISVLTNDSDANGDPLMVTGATNGANGTASFNGANGTVTYTPNANFNGSDTFTYTISDGNGGTDTANVTITVDPVNDAPDAVNDTATTGPNSPVIVSVLANDTDVDGDSLTVTGATNGANGTAVVSGGGTTVTFTPNNGFSGPDSFTYTISDGNGGTDTATVNVTVSSGNETPSLIVTTTLDVVDPTDGLTSLREAIAFANSVDDADGIPFFDFIFFARAPGAAFENGGTIFLTSGNELEITSDIYIMGFDAGNDGTPDVTIDARAGIGTGDAISRVFHVSAGSSVIEGLIISNGSASQGGGVLIDSGAGAVFSNSAFLFNKAGDGGAILNFGTAQLTNVIAGANTATGTGGAIYNSGSLTANGGILSLNSAQGLGGAIFNNGSATIAGTRIDENSAAGGGGVANVDGTLTLTNVMLGENTALFNGGALLTSGNSDTIVQNSTIYTNSAQNYGGGIFLGSAASSLTMTNGTLSGNSANYGGGIYNRGSASLINSTLSGNSAQVSGGGIYSGAIYGLGYTSTINSIVLANSAPTGAETYGNGTLVSIQSLVGGIDPATIFAAIDGVTGGGLLAGNGGPVQTIALLDDAANPAIDSGSDLAGVPDTDARGFSRFDNPGVPNTDPKAIDLGAFELGGTEQPSLIVTTALDVTDNTDGLTSLREALAFANDPTANGGTGDADGVDGSNDTIRFDASLNGSTITLTQGDLVFLSDVTIRNDIMISPGISTGGNFTIDANNASRVLTINSGNVTIDGLTITGGNASGGYGVGGGIYIANGAIATISNSTVSGNSANRFGGGITVYGTATINNSTISNNTSAASGGIDSLGTLTLTNSTISDNVAQTGSAGGILLGSYGTATLSNNTISGNSAYTIGGGMNTGNTNLTLTNITLSGNSAGTNGGGLYNSGTLTLINSTISGNSAQGSGDGIYNNGDVLLRNSIVLGNGGAGGADTGGPGTTADPSGLSIIGGLDPATVFASLDANGGGMLGSNGGSVQTIALLASDINPAFDAGDDSNAPALDGRGNPRFDQLLVANNGGNISDLGAFELTTDAQSLIVTTALDVVDNTDGLTSLREAIAFANNVADADGVDGSNDTITFAPGLSGSTIILTQGQLEIASDVTILGDIDSNGSGDLAIDGNGASRVLRIASGTTAIDGLTVTGGNTGPFTGVDVVAVSGGGIRIEAGSALSLTNSAISNNYAGANGGGIYTNGTLTLNNSTISGNSAFGYGGGIENYMGTVSLINTTVSGNGGNAGGGVGNVDGTLTLTNSTISGNNANFGGGVYSRSFNTPTSTTLNNSIVLGNSAPNGPEIYGTYANQFNLSIVGGVDPAAVFAAIDGNGGGLLVDNGGPVQTIALLANAANPALDASDDALAPVTDARGLARFDQLGLSNNGVAISDLGAFELQLQVNNPPVAADDSATINEDTLATVAVLANDSDFEGDTLTATISGNPANGSVEIVNNIAIYTPVMNFNGTDSFTYTVSDGNGGSDAANVTITVNPVNDAPVAADDTVSAVAGQANNYGAATLLANDSDLDGDTLTISAVGGGVNGSASLNGTTVTFTPDIGFSGPASFTYTVSDGNGGSDTATVSVTVSAGNAPPNAVDDIVSVDEDNSVAISVLANDSDPDGDAISVTGNTAPANGSLTDNGLGNFTYTPGADFNGSDSFTYSVSDGNGGTDTATVSITVNPVNDPPIIPASRSISTDEDTPVQSLLLAGDPDSSQIFFGIKPGFGPTKGSLEFTGSAYVYTPDPDVNGVDMFTAVVTDIEGLSVEGVTTITINPVNDDPVASNDLVVASLNTPRNYAAATLLANDSDVDGDTLTIIAVGGGVNGSASLNGTTVTFTPDAGFTGAASFTYTVSDGNGGTDSATVNVTVTDGNLPPLADAARSVTTLTGTALVFDIAASDPDGDALSFSASTPANGAVSLVGGRVTYTPNAGFSGSETITVTIDDGNGGTATQDVTITTQNLPAANQFVMFTANGFTGGAGGSGAVNGTDAFQQIAVIDGPGAISLDPSFNKGGDILQLSGDASAWNITRSGSSALFSDGDTFITVPVGTAGLAVLFDDGVRSLKFDGSSFAIGGQAFASGTLSPITAAPDGTSLPTGADPAAKAVLFIAADAGIAASGVVDIFGAAGDELARLISGNLTLDASFNRGGDTIAFDEAATDYSASQSGSLLRLTGSDTTALIPVGTSGATLAFGDGSDTRTLLLDTTIPAITIAGQQIGPDPVQLMAV